MTTRTRQLFLAIFTLCSALAGGCEPILVGSSETVTLTPTLDGLDRLTFSNEVNATVVQGSPPAVEITMNQNLQDELVVRATPVTWEVGMEVAYDTAG